MRSPGARRIGTRRHVANHPKQLGGDVGLEGSTNQGAVGYGIGDAYEGKWSSKFIISGRLYYVDSSDSATVTYYCVDLHTGEELWAKTFLNNQSISFGQTLYWQSMNYQGTYAYLWVSSGGGGYSGLGKYTSTLSRHRFPSPSDSKHYYQQLMVGG